MRDADSTGGGGGGSDDEATKRRDEEIVDREMARDVSTDFDALKSHFSIIAKWPKIVCVIKTKLLPLLIIIRTLFASYNL